MEESPQRPKKLLISLRTLWVLIACTSLLLFAVIWSFLFLDLQLKFDNIQLEHGYTLTIYEDWDVYQLYAELHGPGMESQRSMINANGVGKPFFITNKSTDGNIGWVTASTHQNLILIIDYRDGDYWMPGVESKWSEAKQKSYLAKIDSEEGR